MCNIYRHVRAFLYGQRSSWVDSMSKATSRVLSTSPDIEPPLIPYIRLKDYKQYIYMCSPYILYLCPSVQTERQPESLYISWMSPYQEKIDLSNLKFLGSRQTKAKRYIRLSHHHYNHKIVAPNGVLHKYSPFHFALKITITKHKS